MALIKKRNYTQEDTGLSDHGHKLAMGFYNFAVDFFDGEPKQTSDLFAACEKGDRTHILPFWASMEPRLEVYPGDTVKAEDAIGILRPHLVALGEESLNVDVFMTVDSYNRTLLLYRMPTASDGEMEEWILGKEGTDIETFVEERNTIVKEIKKSFPGVQSDSIAETIALHMMCGARGTKKFVEKDTEDDEYFVLTIVEGTHPGYLFDEFYVEGLVFERWCEDVFYTKHSHHPVTPTRCTVGLHISSGEITLIIGERNHTKVHRLGYRDDVHYVEDFNFKTFRPEGTVVGREGRILHLHPDLPDGMELKSPTDHEVFEASETGEPSRPFRPEDASDPEEEETFPHIQQDEEQNPSEVQFTSEMINEGTKEGIVIRHYGE